MRERKYRVWLPETKKMVHFDDCHINYEYGLLAFSVIEEEYQGIANLPDDYDKAIPMDFTGLKDKSGKEIYEGDIVTSCTYNFFNKDHVLDRKDSEEHNLQKGIIEWVPYNCSFMIMKRHLGRLTDQWNNSIELQPNENDRYEIEIIGNIYENPELLTKS